MEDDRERSRDEQIEEVRRSEQRRGRRPIDPESVALRRRLERNVNDLLDLSLDDFLRALKEDYSLNESQLAKAKALWIQRHGG